MQASLHASHGRAITRGAVSRCRHQQGVRRCLKLAVYNRTGGPVLDQEEVKAKARKAAKEVGKTVQELGDQAAQAATRTWRRLDSEYNLQDKFERGKRRLVEQARDVDQTYGVRRRVRSSVEHVQRMWPVWRTQLDEFATTWYGKAVILVVLFLLISSPIFWQVLNFLLLLWWLAIPIGAALLQSAAQRAAEQAAAAQAEEQRRRQANPFADMFKQRAGYSSNMGGSSSSSSSRSSSSRGGYRPPEGPVIDADYVVIKEDGSSK